LTLRRDPPGKPTVPSPAIDFSQTEYVRRGTAEPKPAGLTVSIRKTSLLAVGIALALLGGLFAIHRLHQTGEVVATLPPTNLVPAPRAEQKSAPQGSPDAAVPQPSDSSGPLESVEPSADMMRLNRQLDEVLPDVQTYVVVAPTLTGSDTITLEGIGSLEKLLPRINGADLKSLDVEMLLNRDSWDFPEGTSLKVEPHVFTNQFALAGMIGTEKLFTFDHSAAGQPIQFQTLFTKTPTAVSVLFRPAALRTNLFKPFRLLVINAGNAPAPLQLDSHLLRPSAPSFREAFTGPLRDRIDKFVLTNANWQLRPYVEAKPGEPAKYLYRDWEKRPEFGTELDFRATRKRLTQELAELANRVGGFDKQIIAAEAALHPGVDFNLSLSALLGLTSKQAASFEEYLNRNGAAHLVPTPPGLYLDFLDKLAKQAGPCPWLTNWSAPHQHPEASLNALYDLWVTNIPQAAANLTLPVGPVTNYFLAVWENLQNDKKRADYQGDKKNVEKKIAELTRRLSEVPRQSAQAAYISLCLVGDGPSFPQEAVRFIPSPQAN